MIYNNYVSGAAGRLEYLNRLEAQQTGIILKKEFSVWLMNRYGKLYQRREIGLYGKAQTIGRSKGQLIVALVVIIHRKNTGVMHF